MSGGSYEECDYRARWASKQRMQSRYTAVQLDWPDVSCATKLCEGGACRYKAVEGSGITDEWLASEIAPAICAAFGPGVAKILGLSLLWASFEPSTVDLVPADIRHRVVAKFILLESTVADGVNPVQRVRVVPSEVSGCVSLDEITDNTDDMAT